jgi:hypothetical protein
MNIYLDGYSLDLFIGYSNKIVAAESNTSNKDGLLKKVKKEIQG